MIAFGTALTGLLMLAEPGGRSVGSGSILNPKYHRYDFESACGASVFRVRFRNGRTGRSRVDHVLIDGRPVPDAAETLDRFAAQRSIDRIGIMHCGMDPEKPFFRGVMELRKPESQPYSRHTSLYFRVIRHVEGWRFSAD
jgi:hypothetical protein